MPSTSVVPNGDRSFLPSESTLNIHIVVDQVKAVFGNDIRLVSRNTIDTAIEPLVDIHGLPSCHGCYYQPVLGLLLVGLTICPNQRVRCGKMVPGIKGVASLTLFVDLDTVLSSFGVEEGGVMGSVEGL
jgi:hypothetical protein